jgi:4-hydroxy-tetrahydrodipicolinate reductase
MSKLMPIKICIAGATGWAGSAVTRRILQSSDFQLAGVIARQSAGRDIGEVLGGPAAGIAVVPSLEDVLPVQPDVLIDYTTPDSVKARTFAALDHGLRVVIGTSGLTAEDYHEIDAHARQRDLGVIAAGNFSITAALAKHCALLAAKYDAGTGAEPYVGGTLLAAQRVMGITGMVRGLDRLLFES